ncbi:MAG: low molecular weight phosphotyrosine protein phosphatase [Bacteroidaceae bacterium]|nr:low molecular weight phosphotyrosine protein phosphatase [Bacteroidaceae bacterium]
MNNTNFLKQNKLIRLLFICHGNICRSPMAEFVMKDLVQKAGLAEDFYIESAATSTEELGNEVYPPARRKLAEHGISCKGKVARQMNRRDYERFDLLIGMDSWNIRNMMAICGGDPEEKIHQLLDFTNRPGDVADPWYTRDFEATWRDVLEGCQCLLKQLTI